MHLSSKVVRVAAWCVTIWGACLVYLYSWGGFSSLPDDSVAIASLEEARLRKNLVIAERPGLYDADLYKSQYELGLHYLRRQRYKDSEQFVKKAVQTAQLVFGNDSVERCESLSLLAGIYRDEKNYRLSDHCYHELLDIDKVKNGDQALSVCRDMNNIGVLYFLWGKSFASLNRRLEKFSLAQDMFESCLHILASPSSASQFNDKAQELKSIAQRNYNILSIELGTPGGSSR